MGQELSPVATYATPVVTLTFASPLTLKGVPQFPLSTAELPASAEQTAANVVELTYAVGGVATTVTVPQSDPAIRSSTGGYVASGVYTF